MRRAYRWIVFVVLLLALILIPFALFGQLIERWTEHFLDSASKYSLWVAFILALLLASDILMPIPSSLVSTAAGYFLGFAGGLATSWIGMMISCSLGYWLGKKFGRPLTSQLVGERDLARLEQVSARYGRWAIVVARPVPVLAESSILCAGVSRMAWPSFFVLCVFSNLGVSAVYAGVGSLSATTNTFLMAFAGAVLVPGLVMWIARKRLPDRGGDVRSY
jgi:uncharacterized membrane protein YdjX (TVP38/TMEM64 family)